MSLTQPMFEFVDPGAGIQAALLPEGRRIIVEAKSRIKRVRVRVVVGDWRKKLAAQGKRPLGYLRKCDLTRKGGSDGRK